MCSTKKTETQIRKTHLRSPKVVFELNIKLFLKLYIIFFFKFHKIFDLSEKYSCQFQLYSTKWFKAEWSTHLVLIQFQKNLKFSIFTDSLSLALFVKV